MGPSTDQTDPLLPTYDRLPVQFDRGEGVYLHDDEGNRYLDALAGIAVNILGYRHPVLLETAHEALDDIHHLSNLFEIPSQRRLAEALSEFTFGTRAFFCNSGAEAIEGAIKFCRKYSFRFGNDGRKIITARNSFHGRSLGALTATGQTKYQEGFEPLPGGFEHVSYNDPEALEEAMDDQVCGVLLEPIQGEGGVVPAESSYLSRARELCDEYGSLMVVDEIQSGMGRTGEFLAVGNHEVQPDVVTLAKGLGGGFPIGAFLVDETLESGLQSGDHASTFGGNPFVTKVSCAVLEILEAEGLMESSRERGREIEEELQRLSEEIEDVHAPRGEGLMLGLPLEPPLDAGDVLEEALEEGLLVGTAGENTVRLVPPLILTESEAGKLLERLEAALRSTMEG
jgi:acetylornithine/N-succinyldiaminopimelate aminotransferase